jgi:hypothetical protein
MDAFNTTPVWQMYNIPSPEGSSFTPSIGSATFGGANDTHLNPVQHMSFQQAMKSGSDIANAAGATGIGGVMSSAAGLSKIGLATKLLPLLL